jgi:hypothetical protein
VKLLLILLDELVRVVHRSAEAAVGLRELLHGAPGEEALDVLLLCLARERAEVPHVLLHDLRQRMHHVGQLLELLLRGRGVGILVHQACGRCGDALAIGVARRDDHQVGRQVLLFHPAIAHNS